MARQHAAQRRCAFVPPCGFHREERDWLFLSAPPTGEPRPLVERGDAIRQFPPEGNALCETLASLRSADRYAAPPPGGLAEVGAPKSAGLKRRHGGETHTPPAPTGRAPRGRRHPHRTPPNVPSNPCPPPLPVTGPAETKRSGQEWHIPGVGRNLRGWGSGSFAACGRDADRRSALSCRARSMGVGMVSSPCRAPSNQADNGAPASGRHTGPPSAARRAFRITASPPGEGSRGFVALSGSDAAPPPGGLAEVGAPKSAGLEGRHGTSGLKTGVPADVRCRSRDLNPDTREEYCALNAARLPFRHFGPR